MHQLRSLPPFKKALDVGAALALSLLALESSAQGQTASLVAPYAVYPAYAAPYAQAPQPYASPYGPFYSPPYDASLARAQSPATLGDPGARLRAGVYGAVGMVSSCRSVECTPLGLGLRVVAGVQVNDRFALVGAGIFSTSFLRADLRGAVLAELTPRPWLSIASGFSVERLETTVPTDCGFFGTHCGLRTEPALGVSVPLSFAYHASERTQSGARRGLSGGLEGRAGLLAQSSSSEPFGAGDFFLGYDWM